MLPHAIYYDTLASIADESSDDWKATVAGLFVLRLVDDWLDFGPHIVTTDISGLAIVCNAIDQVPNTNPCRVLLQRIVDTVRHSETAAAHAVAGPMLAYAQSLEYDAKFALEEEVLSTLHGYAAAADDKHTLVVTSIRLGIVSRNAGKLNLAEHYHQSAITHATATGDTANLLLARLGQAKTVSVRGDLGRADELCAAVVRDAELSGITEMHGRALHDRAYMAYLKGNYQDVVRFGHLALEHVNTPSLRDRILSDIAAGFIRLGHTTAARDTNLILASCAAEQEIRWHATIHLMDCSAREWQEHMFELYRAALACADLPPRISVYYHFTAGYGYRTFGDLQRAQDELQTAQALAEKYGMQQLVFELEQEQEELTRQPQQYEWSPEIDAIADAIGEQREFYALNM